MFEVRFHTAFFGFQAEPVIGVGLGETVAMHAQFFLHHSFIFADKRKVLERGPYLLYPLFSLVDG